MARSIVLAFLLGVVVNAIPQGTADTPSCFNDCINQNSQGFNCVGLELTCYCNFDNGKFWPKFKDCITKTCPQAISIIAAANCPSNNSGGSSSGVSVVTTTTPNTLTFTNAQTVTGTVVAPITGTGTVTVIDESTTAKFTTKDIVLTTYITQGTTTRALTLTTQVVGNVTVGPTSTSTTGGSGTTVVVVPSTVQTTFTNGGSTITSALTTVSATSTKVGGGATTTTQAGGAARGEVGTMAMAVAVGLGAFGGFFGL